MSALRYVVGVDGGASKTVALVGTENGEIMGRGRSGASNYHNVGKARAMRAIKKAVVEAQERAGLVGRRPELAVVALAAVDSTRDRLTANHFVQAANIARRCIVVHDSVAALYAATEGKPGLIVISGTGCVAAGINYARRYVRAGGWGYMVDDEGSAYDIGKKALRTAFRSLDGRAPTTKLVSLLKLRFRARRLDDVLNRIYTKGFTVEEIARLAPLVSKGASHDKACMQILNNAGVTLAELTCAVARRLNMRRKHFTVALVGGTFNAGRYVLGPFQARLRKECPYAKIRRLKIEPVRGAFSLAVLELRRRYQLKCVSLIK